MGRLLNSISSRFNYIQGNISSGRERLLSLKLTVRPENRPVLKMKGSSSNHPFSDSMSVLGSVYLDLLKMLGNSTKSPYTNPSNYIHP